MSWINMRSRRSFDFTAPYNEEGDRCITVPFPVAITREVMEGKIVHDANPTLVENEVKAEAVIQVETQVQAGTMLIFKNIGTAAATIGEVECAGGYVTTLMYDGNGYIKIGTTEIT